MTIQKQTITSQYDPLPGHKLRLMPNFQTDPNSKLVVNVDGNIQRLEKYGTKLLETPIH